MKFIVKQFKQILLTTVFLLCVATTMSQIKHKPVSNQQVINKPISSQLKDFYHLLDEAGVEFVFPQGFREIPVINNEDFSFDYAMEIPDQEFEIWFQVKSQKRNWVNYERLKNDVNKRLANPDSSYISIGRAQAIAFTDEQDYFTRNIAPEVLTQYNAGTGKSYLLSLPDMSTTKHYKYALLLTLQKDHIGTILVVCFTNEKGPEFFRNVNQVSRYLKFKL
jgi:hypothetical protein